MAYQTDDAACRRGQAVACNRRHSRMVSTGRLRLIRSSLPVPIAIPSNSGTGGRRLSQGPWCRREVLLHKIDAVLGYFSGLQSGQDQQIGFRRS